MNELGIIFPILHRVQAPLHAFQI